VPLSHCLLYSYHWESNFFNTIEKVKVLFHASYEQILTASSKSFCSWQFCNSTSLIKDFILTAGVDIGRFAQDPEYKRETILGLAM